MKKYYVPFLLVLTSVVFSYCHGSKKATAAAPKLTYQNNIQTLIAGTCSPCHIPAKGGNKKPFDTYAAAQENIDAMITRIELNPTEKGFMPFKKLKLSDSTIAVFKQWKADGLVQ